MKRSLPARRPRVIRRPAQPVPAPPPLHLRHYKHVYWMLNGGPLVTAYRAVVVHDGCNGCAVCDGTTDWFMEFARIADRKSTRLNSSHQLISYAVFCLKKKKKK